MESEHVDPVEEIREIRRRLSDQFGNDPVRICEFLMEYQKQFGDRLYSRRHGAPAPPATGTRNP